MEKLKIKRKMETWKKINEHSTRFLSYYVSDEGRVKSVTLDGVETILKPQKQSSGYLQVKLCVNGNVTACLVHRLVGLHFLELPKGTKAEEMVVHHRDSNRENNRLSNLAWATQMENINTPECIAKMALSKSQKILARNIETGELVNFDSMQDASDILGVYHETITKVMAENAKVFKDDMPVSAYFDFDNLHKWYSSEVYITDIAGGKWALYRVERVFNEEGEVTYTSPHAKRTSKKNRRILAEREKEQKAFEKEVEETGFYTPKLPRDQYGNIVGGKVLPTPFKEEED